MKNNYFIIAAILCVFYIIHQVRKDKFSIKESFWWFTASILILVLAIFPGIVDWFAIKLNIAYPPSLLFVVCILFLIFINLRDSKRLGEQNTKIIELGQQLSILKNRIDSNDKKEK